MSDLISRQDAIEAVQKVWCNNDDQKDFKQRYYEMGNNDAVEDAIGYIDALPSADAVEVVRCMNCKHRRENCGMGDHRWCDVLKMTTMADDFCSYGERREDGEA